LLQFNIFVSNHPDATDLITINPGRFFRS